MAKETTYEEIARELKNRIYKPVYYLMGEESYYIDRISEYIAQTVLNENEKEFNQTIVYGADTDIATVINAAMTAWRRPAVFRFLRPSWLRSR